MNPSAAFGAFVMSRHASLPTTRSVSEISILQKEKMVQGHRVCQRQAGLAPQRDAGAHAGLISPFRPSLCSGPSAGPGRKALSPFPGLGLAGGPASAPGGSADGARSGVAAGSPARDPLPGRGGGGLAGVQAAGTVYQKPPGAPSWDCSHVPALFLVKCY